MLRQGSSPPMHTGRKEGHLAINCLGSSTVATEKLKQSSFIYGGPFVHRGRFKVLYRDINLKSESSLQPFQQNKR